jgi:ligand-binding sensor domain-containing protein/serine phosphatase RsbU (regulator of sigma subunit)
MTLKHSILAFILCVFAAKAADAQSYRTQFLDESDGLHERFIYTIDQDEEGFLLAGTSNGLYRYDGFSFQRYDESNGLAAPFITASLAFDGAMYFGHTTGELTRYQSGVCEPLSTDSLLNGRVLSMAALDEKLWVLGQGSQLLSWNGTFEVEKLVLDGAMARELIVWKQRLLVATDLGVAEVNPQSREATFLDDTFGESITAMRVLSDGRLLLALEENGLAYLTEENTLDQIESITPPQGWLVNALAEDHTGRWWLATNGNGVHLVASPDEDEQLLTHPHLTEGELPLSIRSLLIDREGNAWLGTNGEGLIMMSQQAFAIHRFCDEEECSIDAIYKDGSQLWLASDDKLFECNMQLDTLSCLTTENGLPDVKVSAMLRDASGRQWIGTAGAGLYYRDVATENFQLFELPGDRLNRKINALLSVGGLLYVATDFGIYQISKGQVRSHLTMRSGLPHNVVNTLFKDSRGRIWVGTHNTGLTYLESGVIQNIRLPIQKLVDAFAFTEDHEGAIWVGTDGIGVVRLTDNDIRIYDRSDGLFSTYCYGLTTDAEGTVWIAHRSGISRMDKKRERFEVFDEEDLDDRMLIPDCLTATEDGKILFGTNSGLLTYDIRFSPDVQVAPRVNLRFVNVSDSLYPVKESIDLPYGTYRIDFGFVGLNYRDPQKVRYRYLLEGHDLDWSEPVPDDQVRYSRLAPGDYTFRVKAYDVNGYGSEEEATVELSIRFPFWEQWWFYIVSMAFTFLLIWFIIRQRERVLRLNQERLQRELDLRTREVVEKKELLEIKNKDITDSIRYAKNIQKAMLPEPDILSHFFRDSFVFFKPRDIVSGDFYWTERFGNKVLVACADCTGHGVPGAFMSVIGTVLLNDSSRNNTVWSPDDLLYTLDEKLTSMLYREQSAFSVQDGMDISIVEYDFDTQVLRMSSARRPIIVYSNGERFEFKGDRNSVGGAEQSDAKNFTLHEMKLSPGDSFYQFSDGIADQFGGPKGKKLKKRGVLELFDEVVDRSMHDQYKHLRNAFIDWKGKHPQIDDIIVVGVRV